LSTVQKSGLFGQPLPLARSVLTLRLMLLAAPAPLPPSVPLSKGIPSRLSSLTSTPAPSIPPLTPAPIERLVLTIMWLSLAK
jgi:hypothetical protein